MGAHLVYFPLLASPSQLASDGADKDHVPSQFELATPETGDESGGRRLWVGGDLSFRKGWRERLRLDGRPWMCSEEVAKVDVKGDRDKFIVDLDRRYGLEKGQFDVEERRTLAFVKTWDNDGAKSKGIKCESSPLFFSSFVFIHFKIFVPDLL